MRDSPITLLISGPVRGVLEDAFREALPGEIVHIPTFAVPKSGLGKAVRWRLCVEPELGRRIKAQGWRDGLIFVVDRVQFHRHIPPVGRGDALLFYDVPAESLKAAIRMALAGMTLFPADLLSRSCAAAPFLAGFDSLAVEDHPVMAELALGHTDREIAASLNMSRNQVRQSVNRILQALGCMKRTEAAVIVHSRLRPFLAGSARSPTTL